MKKLHEIKIYPLIVIIGVAALLFALRLSIFQDTPPAKHDQYGNCVELNREAFGKALKDTCNLKMSKNKLKCNPELIQRILIDVDSSALASISDNSITFENEKEYIKVPAAVIANMVDLNLFKKPTKEECDGK